MKRQEQINEVRTIIVSLLASYQHNLSLAALDNAYFRVENERVPWRKLGYESLCAFLRSMPEDFEVYSMNGTNYVRGLESEKSSHVKSLVSRQKSNSKPRCFSSHASLSYTSSSYPRTTIHISMLTTLVQYINTFSNGISVQDAIRFMRTQYPNIRLCVNDLKTQLREVSHQVYLDNNMIYSRHSIDNSQRYDPQQLRSKPNLQANSHTVSSMGPVFVAAGLSDEEDVDNTGVVADDYENNQSRRSSEEFERDFRNSNQMLNGIINDHDDVGMNDITVVQNAKTNLPYSERVKELINDKIKLRLSKLIQKYPDGIKCAELPDKYLKEFNVHLNYTELGFTSVREFIFYLPNIFYMKRLDVDGDFLLLSADKRPTVPELQSSRNENIEEERQLYNNEEEFDRAKSPPIPTDIPANIANRAFVPDDAMKYHESIKLIPVTELKEKKFLEVYVSEVFNPSFFWIHLRQYRDQLIQLMEDINEFYTCNFSKYIVPKVGLIKGLHCACVYDERWHRGVIKSVKPDFQVTILFIDYGTVKTYLPDDICYLHKRFARLPVQAIPCGLFNVRPHVGDRWSSTANKNFCDRISGHLLAATVHSVDTTHNSLMVILTDTSEEEEEVHINDWLVNRNLAQCAETDTVDMANLVKYALNIYNRLPIYCFAEDNLIPERRNQGTSTEDIQETRSISSEQVPRDSLKKQKIKPPPGFKPIKETKLRLSTTESSSNYALGNVSNPVNSPAKTSPVSILTDSKSETSSIDIILGLWNENITLYNRIFDALPNIILKETVDNEAMLENHITIQKKLNTILHSFVKALKLDDDKPNVNTSNTLNGAMSNNDWIDSAFKNTLSSNNEVLNQVFETTTTNVSPNPFNSSNSDEYSSSNLFKTGELSPSISSHSPFSSMFKNYIPNNSCFSNDNQKTENVLLTMSSTSNNITSSPSCNVTKSVPKETNPFRMFMTGEFQSQETQNQVTNSELNSNSSYCTSENSQNHFSIIKDMNIQTTNSNCTPIEHFYINNHEKYSPKIVYESGPVMYNTQTKQDKSIGQNNNNFDNAQNTFNLNQCDKNFPLSYNVATSTSNQCYITQPSMKNLQTSSVTNNEPKHQLHNSNINEQPAQIRTYMENPEQLINWNGFSPKHHNENFTLTTPQERQTTNMPQRESICNIKDFVSRNVYQTPDLNYVNQINYLRKNLSDICLNLHKLPYKETQNLEEKQNSCNTLASHSFFFKPIDPMKGASLIFHVDGNGWILVYEFIESFTDLTYSSLVTIIEAMDLKEACQFKNVQRYEYPRAFLDLDRHSLNLPRDSEHHITSVLLISFHTALLLLYKLKKILPEEIENIYKRSIYPKNDSILNKIFTLMIDYVNFKQEIEQFQVRDRTNTLI
ncbi:uncharacterized protein LOC109856261 isoform X2 [Pseudomyrmex gracilis]|uniref:uncharacterized protein LOC109856261 isoform X2 n=1 Tax=Pseudomyrmex gracilis TaxID=219809 RepID=UPI000994E733|nr:uncharacterized protein LOC109856261 isoform X2 [Pseudomyrmex gracilis]